MCRASARSVRPRRRSPRSRRCCDSVTGPAPRRDPRTVLARFARAVFTCAVCLCRVVVCRKRPSPETTAARTGSWTRLRRTGTTASTQPEMRTPPPTQSHTTSGWIVTPMVTAPPRDDRQGVEGQVDVVFQTQSRWQESRLLRSCCRRWSPRDGTRRHRRPSREPASPGRPECSRSRSPRNSNV